jgi:hypothetical protein
MSDHGFPSNLSWRHHWRFEQLFEGCVMKPHYSTKILTVVFLAVAGTASHATTLNPGGSTMVTGTTEAANPELAGTIINDGVLTSNGVGLPANSNFAVRLQVQNRVVKSGMNLTLIFAPRILEDLLLSLGPFLVDRVVMFGFGSFDIDASYRVDDVGDRGPTAASRSADGNVLDFQFGFPLPITSSIAVLPSEESYFFSLRTDATAFENTGRLAIFGRAVGDNSNTYRLDVAGLAVPFEAITAVPLPASAPLLLGGLALVFGVRRKNNS